MHNISSMNSGAGSREARMTEGRKDGRRTGGRKRGGEGEGDARAGQFSDRRCYRDSAMAATDSKFAASSFPAFSMCCIIATRAAVGSPVVMPSMIAAWSCAEAFDQPGIVAK